MKSKTSRFLAALVYLYWLPVAWFIFQHPGHWGEQKFMAAVSRAFTENPEAALYLGLVAVWRPFERSHWIRAVIFSAVHFTVTVMMFLIAYVCIVTLIGIPLGMLLFGLMPIWVVGGWALHLGLALHAASGGEPFDFYKAWVGRES